MSKEEARTELETIAAIQAELPSRRAKAVEAARAENMTWREIARILDMSEMGVIKADKKWQESK